MNLILVTGRFPQRSETFIYRKAVTLARRGHRVDLMSRQLGDWALYPEPLPGTLRVEVLPPDHSLLHARRLSTLAATGARLAWRAPGEVVRLGRQTSFRSFIRHMPFVRRTADVVHFEFVGLGAMYPLARELVGAPTIMSCRGQEIHTLALRPEPEQRTFVEAMRNADALHCVSDEMAGVVARATGRRDNLWVIRPAVDTTRIRARTDAPRSGPLKIFASGRLVWVKGYDYLLSALAHLRARGLEFHAEIAGEGELRKYLRFSIHDLGLERHVVLLGGLHPDDVLSRLQAADVFVLSSFEEGISNAALEAMASSVPVVTTRAGGMLEAVTHEAEGLVVPTRDATALADSIERVARDDRLRRAMARAARARVEAEFSLERQAEDFEAMYRAVQERRR